MAGGGKSSVVDAAAPDGGPTSWILACTAVAAACDAPSSAAVMPSATSSTSSATVVPSPLSPSLRLGKVLFFQLANCYS